MNKGGGELTDISQLLKIAEDNTFFLVGCHINHRGCLLVCNGTWKGKR